MPKFTIVEKHIAFVNAIVSGVHKYKAYQDFISERNCSKQTAGVKASELFQRNEIKALYHEMMKAKRDTIVEVIKKDTERMLPPEFSSFILTIDERDLFHHAVMQGKVEVEEIVSQYVSEEILNRRGQVVSRKKSTNFVRVKRPPNIRERQVSADALYKRYGEYAPTKVAGMFKVTADEEAEEGDRFFVLSNGERLPLY